MISSISSISGIHSHLHLQVAEIIQTSWQLEEEKSNVTDNDDSNKNEKARDDEAVIIAFVLPAGLNLKILSFRTCYKTYWKLRKMLGDHLWDRTRAVLSLKLTFSCEKQCWAAAQVQFQALCLKKEKRKNEKSTAPRTLSSWLTLHPRNESHLER